MEGHEGGIFSILFSLKEIPGCPNKEHNLAFKQNIRAYPSSKKTALTNYWESIANWQESEKTEALMNKFSLSQIQLGDLRELRDEETFAIFLLFEAWKQYFQHLN